MRPPTVASPNWILVSPPEVADAGSPRGIRLLPAAPVSEWHAVAAFDTEEGCNASRLARTNDAIDLARTMHGDDARFELPVRRAVNLRCIPRGVLQSAGEPVVAPR